MPPFVVSACLAGVLCRYDGGHSLCASVAKLVNEGRAIALCPEVLANLPTPRTPCEIQGDLVCNASGQDFTAEFLKGAKIALEQSLAAGCSKAILKTRSPSCGRDSIYDGSFSRKLVKGKGLWAKLLHDNGFEIFTEEDLPPKI